MAGEKTICVNRRARHDYDVLRTVEAGLALTGPEVKSLRSGRAHLRDAYGVIERQEAWLLNAHISLSPDVTLPSVGPHLVPKRGRAREVRAQLLDPRRPRKLLLHRDEIRRLHADSQQKGLTLVPLRLYFNAQGKAKVELAVARGRRLYDKREAIKRRDEERAQRREAAERQQQPKRAGRMR
jgi:SsrA-binding protein